MPSKIDILLGLLFILAGIALDLCDQWALRTKVEGLPTLKAHDFNHVFFMWTLKQILLAFLLPLWKAIDANWLGMRRFRHAECDPADRRRDGANPIMNLQDNLIVDNIEDDENNGDGYGAIGEGVVDPPVDQEVNDDQQALIRPDPPQPANPPLLYRRRAKKYTKLLYFPPALFSQAYVILIYFGMRLTYPSSNIMLKGTEPIFVFLLALAFLAQQIAAFMWIGAIVVVCGFAVSGLSDYIHIIPDGYEPYGIAAGDLLFVMGQITLATQMIYEEKYMRKHSIHPMKFLGSEGVYSMLFSIISLVTFNYVDTVQYTQLPNYHIEDVCDALAQLRNSWQLIVAVIGGAVSYVMFMYLGILIIKDHGAMPRVMITMMSSAIYWAISVGIDWQNFFISQVPGLVMVPCGLLIYSHILVFPCLQGNNVAGEIGPNDFFAPDEEINQHNEEAGAGSEDGELQNGNEVDLANGDARMMEDGAFPPGLDGGDSELLNVLN